MQSYTYENIEMDDHLPVHMFLHSTHQVPNHWHDSIEILFVLKGKLELFTKDRFRELNEEDLFLINANEIHAIKAEENNLVLALQIPVSYLLLIEPQIERMLFDCNSAAASYEEQSKFDELRTLLAEMMLLHNKRPQGYHLRIQSCLLNLTYLLMQGFREQDQSPEKHDDKHRERLLRITSYVKENYNRAINIQQLALQEYLTVPYLSRFFKEYMGTSFTKYVNAVRLDKAVKDLTLTNLSITQIAHDHGFPNLKSFNAVFKEFYRQTPGEYRKTVLDGRSSFQKSSVAQFNYFDMNPTQAFESLFKYLPNKNLSATSNLPVALHIHKQTHEISVKSNQSKELAHTWKKLMTVGKAKEVLFAEVQRHIKQMQQEIGFQYIRFHGIFDDEMMIYGENERGEVSLNFAYSDSLFDFLLCSGLKPFLELSFLPRQLAGEGATSVFYKKSLVGSPKDLGKWNQMIHQFITHYIHRYGIHEVRQWYFEVWNEPEIHIFWPDTYEAYCELFISTFQTIKSIDSELRVGGPGVLSLTLMQSDWLTRFMNDVCRRGVKPDFISFHSYPYDESLRSTQVIQVDYEENPDVWFQTIELSADTEYLSRVIIKLKKTVSEAMGSDVPELHMTEWNATGSHRDLVNDTCFKAAYIVKNVLKNMDGLHSFGYWTATDLLEEFKMSSETFHGGLGLMTYNGIPKPSFYAFKLLAKLGRQFIHQGKGYYITSSDMGLQVLMYAYAHIDSLYQKGDASLINRTNRYDVFEEVGDIELTLELTDIHPGSYTIKRHTINRRNGSVFDLWVRMGAPHPIDADTLNYLKQASCPQLTFEQVEITSTYSLISKLSPHEVQLVELMRL
ncbi:GH39 family glycosyl hydrolase [Paenibacillus sp. B2(2019)]|uniref:GH39 family glycosyl hydrolase n=1 Tax=Paenibacillus sp. B2(2019) TaxID=2607754 RepID=UPI0011F2C1FB|nr:helix-turn-helix domain-containing protein [Paenibacillus sp. B2(2019)]KAA1181899.1 helix-turn-helix domain-containing protein [Paenibacillus sp. B2(2019)]